MKKPIHIAHLLYRLDIGGLERFMVDGINRSDPERYTHTVISLTDATEFRDALNPSIEVVTLHKKPGLDLPLYTTLFRQLRRLKPDILHSYNLTALEYQVIARMAGVRSGLHAEHGRDAADPEGKNRKHRWLRKFVGPWVQRYVCVSDELSRWMANDIGIDTQKISTICNGVDTQLYRTKNLRLPASPKKMRFVHVARLNPVKNQALLIDAFAEAMTTFPSLELHIYGDGPLKNELQKQIDSHALRDSIFLHGASSSIERELPHYDVFILSSIAEGTPMTLLEAMAVGLPVIATAVGGIPRVVEHGHHGLLVGNRNRTQLTDAIKYFVTHPQQVVDCGRAAAERVANEYSVAQCDAHYERLYGQLMENRRQVFSPLF